MHRFFGSWLNVCSRSRTHHENGDESAASCLPASAHVATRLRPGPHNECGLGFSFQQACYWGLSWRCWKVLSGRQQNVVLSVEHLAGHLARRRLQKCHCENSANLSLASTQPVQVRSMRASAAATLQLAFRHAPAGMYGPHR